MVGCGIGRTAGIPVVTFAKSVRVSDDKVTVERVLDEGFETVEACAPLRHHYFQRTWRAAQGVAARNHARSEKAVADWDAAALGVDRAMLATNAAVLRERLYIPVKEGSCELIAGDTPQQIAQRLAERLFAEKII
jgi:electron transfer flavoprotein alpha/beta subunit